MLAPEVAFDKLAAFSNLSDLADFFEAEGVTGCMKETEYCPISNWLRGVTGMPVSTNGECIEFILWRGDPQGVLRYEPTTAMVEFMAVFDNGDLPELVAL